VVFKISRSLFPRPANIEPRVGRECQYVAPSPSLQEIKRLRKKLERLEHSAANDATAAPFDVTRRSTPSNLVSEADLFADRSPFLPFFTNDPFRYSQLRTPFVNVTVMTDVSKIVGSMEDHQKTAQLYFDSIHTWMPIISIQSYLERLQNLMTEPQADFALLSLCLYLVVQVPSCSKMDSMRTSLYAKAKSLYSLVESTGIISVRTVQSGILISLYELGHGLFNEACISISGCGRAAMILGLDTSSSTNPSENLSKQLDMEEKRRVWWGIVILDRYA
jgi:hypothetical protein